MEKNKSTLGGFEAILDSFIPNNTKQNVEDIDIDDPIDDEELDNIKSNIEDPIVAKMKKDKNLKDNKEDEEDQEDIDIEEEQEEQDEKPKRKPGRPKKEDKQEEEEDDNVDNDISSDNAEDNIITNFFDAISEKLGWEFEEGENKPKDVDELIEYFQNVIEEESKPVYANEEVEALDNFVKQGGDIKKYLTIEAELDLDTIDIEDEYNQKIIVKQLLKEKGFSDKRIEKQLSKYEEAGLLEDEAQDALEDLKEIKEQKKEQLLKEQEKVYHAQLKRQQEFYDSVVSEIKGLKNIRGITVPEKDKQVLINYILKPDTDGKTKYQKDYAKGGVKNLIESAYFTMNADKILEAAKRQGSNSAIDKFKKSLKSTSIKSSSRQSTKDSEDEPIWSSFARKLRI